MVLNAEAMPSRTDPVDCEPGHVTGRWSSTGVLHVTRRVSFGRVRFGRGGVMHLAPTPTLPRERGRGTGRRVSHSISFPRLRITHLPPLAGEGWDGGMHR